MMKLTQRLLDRAARLAWEKLRVQEQLTKAFEERYGVTYSNVDADEIIDVLDYYGGRISLAECDRVMTDCGYPPREQGDER